MRSLSSYPIRHRTAVYLTAAPVLSLAALSTTPSLVPTILLLTVLRLHVVAIVRRPDRGEMVAQTLLVSVAVALRHAAPSLHALSSTPVLSILLLTLLSTVTTVIAGASVLSGYYMQRKTPAPWTSVTVFPAVWASSWALVEYASPIGQLTTWSPVKGLAGYDWVRPYGGQVIVNWIVAAWAVVLAEAAGAWMVGSGGESLLTAESRDLISYVDDDIPTGGPAAPPPERSAVSSKTRHTLLLATLLVALTVPSLIRDDLPLPIASPDLTPFGVGCVLPYPHKNGKPTGPPTLEHYISESHTLQSQAKVVLWPEGAVHFDSPKDKDKVLERIRTQVSNGSYYGIGFEELMHTDSPDGEWKTGDRRNGFVLLGFEGVVYEYYKRNLVPLVESFSMRPSTHPPSIFTMQLSRPKGYSAPEWAPYPNFTRPIDLTASICLDFAHSSAFASLPSRPSLILAPARTWHTAVGLAMWEQAQARALEAGSMLLWCDGGAGGVSGIAGPGRHGFRQVGPGSWAQTVSVPWPLDQRRTVFAAGGTSVVLAALWAVCGMGWIAEGLLMRLGDYGQRQPVAVLRLWRGIVGRITGRRGDAGEEQPLLG